jgi:hypothetical protein
MSIVLFLWGIGKLRETWESALKGLIERMDMRSSQHSQVLGVSESGFYAWRKRPTCRRKQEDAQLTSQIRQVFESHQERYGSPRLHAEAIRSRDQLLA